MSCDERRPLNQHITYYNCVRFIEKRERQWDYLCLRRSSVDLYGERGFDSLVTFKNKVKVILENPKGFTPNDLIDESNLLWAVT